MQPRERFVMAGPVELALYEWGEPGAGPTLFFVHATGFHARCWDRVIDRLPGHHCLAVDVRGHGRSAAPPPPYAWPNMAGDLIELAQQIGLTGAVGIGHSMGGHLLVRMAAALPHAFVRLLLIEPVIFPRFVYGHAPAEHFASRRRNHFPSPDAMFERYQDRPPFATWDQAVLRDYVTHGLRPDPAGEGYVLACPPAVEAAIYLTGMAKENDPYPLLPQVEIPVDVVRASYAIRADGGFDMQASPTAADLAECFPNATDQHLPQYSHFLPMEDPGLVAQMIRSLNDDDPRDPDPTAG